MDLYSPFIPMDRRQALAHGLALPERATGAALLADLAGYTALTTALIGVVGQQRGAEELTRLLTPVFEVLVNTVHRYRGSVLCFAGVAVTCWFDDAGERGSGLRRAATAALAMQDAMAAFATLDLPGGATGRLALHCALIAGSGRRLLVGDPAIQQFDVLAGAALTRLNDLKEQAGWGETVLDRATAEQLALL